MTVTAKYLLRYTRLRQDSRHFPGALNQIIHLDTNAQGNDNLLDLSVTSRFPAKEIPDIMKHTHFTTVLKLIVALVFSLSVSAYAQSACQVLTWKYLHSRPSQCVAYTGPRHLRAEVAILKLKWVRVEKVDGKPAQVCYKLGILDAGQITCDDAKDSVELLPGIHTISFRPYGAGVSGDSISKDINVSAGKTYQAKRHNENWHSTSSPCYPTATRPCNSSSEGKWTVDIAEE
jgi:hypothetical protein